MIHSRTIVILISLLSGAASFAQGCPNVTTSENYKIEQRLFTFGSNFKISDPEGKALGSISQKLFNFAKVFELRNADDQLVATARQRLFSLGEQIDVADCNGVAIGSLKEDILKSLFSLVNIYSILDAHEHLVGQSEKFQFMSTDILFFDEQHQVLGEAHRPWATFLGETWNVKIMGQKLDNRVLLFAPAFKTSADSDKNDD